MGVIRGSLNVNENAQFDRAYDFLLALHSNLMSCHAPFLRYSEILVETENHSPWAIVWRCSRDPMLSHFATIPGCDIQTEDTLTAYTALA